jgi:segregation and condensation protein A
MTDVDADPDAAQPAAGVASDPLWDDWETPPRRPSSPVLHLEGFDGPMDLLLDLAERQRIDIGRMSILDLAEQFVAAMARLADRVTLEQRADWLVLATRLVLLRSRLLFPDSPEAAAAAAQDAAAELRRLDDLAAMRAAGVWLQQRPQLGLDVFARRPASVPREGGYVALMEACLVVLRGREGRPEEAPLYRPAIPDLWRVVDALARIETLLAAHPAGGDLAAFLPPVAGEVTDRPLRARAAVASTFLAGLELAREGTLTLGQEVPFETLQLAGAFSGSDERVRASTAAA